MERSQRVFKFAGVVLAVVALVLLLLWMQGILGGGKIEPGERALEPQGPERAYVEQPVSRKTYTDFEEAVGTVTARREVYVASRVMGTVLELPVKAGDQVQQGTLLVRIDDRDVKARLAQARAAAAEAQSEYARARSDHERFQRLRAEKAATQQQFEQAQAAYRAAGARLERAGEAVREAEVNLGYTVIRSPVDGFVVEKSMAVGDMATPGQPILMLQEGGSLRLDAAVREGLANRINLGDRLTVRIDALDSEMTGAVEEKVPVADPRSRSFLVKISLPQKPGLRSGMFGRLFLPTETVTPLTVPREAVQRTGQLETVWVLGDDGHPRRRYVRTGKIYDESVEVISGLDEGETVLIVEEEDGPSTPEQAPRG